MFHKRIVDRKKLHAALVDSGYDLLPHHEEEPDDFNSTVNAIMAAESVFETFQDHFDFSPSSSVDSGPSFDGGGGESGGGGASGEY